VQVPRRVRRPTRENVVPLINVVFLLLIFFLLTGTLRRAASLEVEPPVVAVGEEAEPVDAPLVIDRSGRLAWGSEEIERATLVARLAARPAAAPLRVRADARLPARLLLPLLERIREAGVTEIELATREGAP
jgi:biopolymer transport protein ExbD